jgi:8-oxo-dGTP pyrophosphatase MutT (NUDIX family)
MRSYRYFLSTGWFLVGILSAHIHVHATVQALTSPTISSSKTVAQNLLTRVRRNDCAADAAREAKVFYVGGRPMGHILPFFADILSQFPSVFDISQDSVSLVDNPEWDELSHDTRVFARSRVVQEVLESLRDQDLVPALGGWRNEPFAVRQDFHSPPELIMERAAGVLFGAPAYGVFLNGYTCQDDDENHIDIDSGKPTHVWIGRRAKNKATWPGRLDSLAAGGLAAGMLPRQAMMQECQEEAGICKEALLDKIQAVSAVSYTGYNEDMWGLKRDVLFCFDLQLPPDFEPVPVDGEVDSFEKMSIATIMDLLQKPVCEDDDSDNEWKPNVGVVLIDFLLRHGAIDADDIAFLPLVESLRGAKCA